MVVLAGTVAASCAASLAVMAAPAVGAVARADSWGKAIEVPGLARLSAGHGGTLVAVSCSSAGNCSAGGNYDNRSGHGQAYVVSEKNGSWGTAIEVPGSAAFGVATVASVSCASAGNCAAAGFSGSITNDAPSGPLVASEKNGTWSNVIAVAGTTASARNSAGSVSCGSVNYCAAGGSFAPSIEGPYQAFVVREKNGSWGTAIEVPGLAALNVGGSADVESVSCGQARYCAAGGTYRDGNGYQQAFVVSDINGAWGTAIEVPGSAALNTGGSAQITSVSCTSARYCVAAGDYTELSGNGGAFLVSRT
jgi:hypothetical protein